MQNLKNISFKNVHFKSGFWHDRYNLNRKVSLKSVYKRFEETYRFEALRFQYDKTGRAPHVFYDSDVAKWIEAVAYLIELDKDGYLEEQKIIDKLVDSMEQNQLPNGYLNSHFIQVEPDKIFKNRNDHELYCAGHLLEAAIAYAAATGKDRFLKIMLRYIDCIERAFIIEKTAEFVTPGHEEIELALLKLYDYLHDEKYLQMAMFFLNSRGTPDTREKDKLNFFDKADCSFQIQSDVPVREIDAAKGHAVRATYLYIAMCEAALKTNDIALRSACERIYKDITTKQMYVTGGIGSTRQGEAFTVAYDLPNKEAYSESCAGIGLLLFSLSMQQFGKNAHVGSVIERILYNILLSPTSLNGKSFFYENPLELHMGSMPKYPQFFKTAPSKRAEVFDCSCCPPNINRIFARIGDVFFSADPAENALVVNQYAQLTLTTENIRLHMQTQYPLNGQVRFEIADNRYSTLYLRIPEWSDSFTVSETEYTVEDGYLKIENAPESFSFSVDFQMQPFFIRSTQKIRNTAGRVALCYGPTVYCLERLDNDFELNALSLPIEQTPAPVKANDYPLPDFYADGFVYADDDALYSKTILKKSPVRLRFKPYYTFANREPCDMLVWIPASM